MKYTILLSFSLLTSLLVSCERDYRSEPLDMPALMEVPAHFPEMSFPEDNSFSQERWELGKTLFYDPVMSRDSSISCATCHNQERSFADNIPFSVGINDRIGTRNAPTLANVGYQPYFLSEGGLNTLEKQILVPIQEHNEFDFNIVLLAERLQSIPKYVELSQSAYDREPDPFVITRSISTFERSFISGQSRYDQFELGNDRALHRDEKKGMDLFFSSKTNCSSCHSDFNFTNYAFENNGLYETYDDPGRKRFTGLDKDAALFKVPSIRNIELTAPYMHDGSFLSLEDVINHYDAGGANHTNKSDLIRPLGLTQKEKDQLLAFLLTLTDNNFVSNPIFNK